MMYCILGVPKHLSVRIVLRLTALANNSLTRRVQWSRSSAVEAMAAPGSLERRLSHRAASADDDLDALSRPILTRRKDFIDKDEEARKSPNRVLYFRRNADYDRLIEACGRKLRDNPRNLRALLIRASSYSKKGE